MHVIISCKQCSCTVQVVSTPHFQLQPKSNLLNATKMQVLRISDYVRYGDKVNMKFFGNICAELCHPLCSTSVTCMHAVMSMLVLSTI